MGEAAFLDVLRRRWQVVVVFAQLGVGIALVTSTALDSDRPLRDILIGLAAGLAMGLIAVRPAEQLAAPPAIPARRGGRHWPQPRVSDVVRLDVAAWPHPQLSERPRPTFPPPRHRPAGG